MFLNMHYSISVWCFICWFCVFEVSSKRNVTDTEYANMPKLFHLDDYDNCKLLENEGLYCFATIQLSPVDPNNESYTWKIIKDVISFKSNYRHDRIRHGVCLHKACPENINNYTLNDKNEELLKLIISNCYNNKFRSKGLKAVVDEINCETFNSSEADIYDILVAVFLLSLIMFTIFASIHDKLSTFNNKNDGKKIMKSNCEFFVNCFSIQRNWKRLGNLNVYSDVTDFQFLNGVKFYNMVMVILTHACMIAFFSPISNPQFTEELTENPYHMVLINGIFAMQTNFLIAGMLLCYHVLAFAEKTCVKFKHLVYIFVHRYVRLTPALMVVIAFNATWLRHLGKGGHWHRAVGKEYENCRENWWINLLYINNIYKVNRMCMQHSWYIAADTQLFTISLFILYLTNKYKNNIKLILGICMLLSCTGLGLVNYINNFDFVIRQYPETFYTLFIDNHQWRLIYTSAICNSGGYVIGIMLGYLLYTYKETQFNIKTSYIIIWWITTWGLTLSVVMIGILFYQDDFSYTPLTASIYVALARNIFAVGISIAVIGLSRNIGWLLRDFIIWKPIKILGRLTYSVYLIHTIFPRIRSGLLRSPMYISYYSLATETFGDLVFSYIFALPLCLIVEMPITALQKLITSGSSNIENGIKTHSSNGAYKNNNNVKIDQIKNKKTL